MINTLNFIESICTAEGIDLYELTGLERLGGLAVKTTDNLRGIMYSDTLNGWAKILTITHELGHHVLGHLDDNSLSFGNYHDKESKRARKRREREAQTFSAAFTAIAFFNYYSQSLHKNGVFEDVSHE